MEVATAEPTQVDNGTAARIGVLLQSPIIPALLLILGLAARVRQYCVNPSYWYDESYLLLNVFSKSCGDLVGPLGLNQAAPPFFLWMLRGLFLLGGPAEWVMRLPAGLASVLALPLLAVLARRLVGSPGWLWALGLCAVSNHALDHAYQVKPYSSDLLFTVAMLFCAHEYLTCGEVKRKWPAACLLILALLAPWCSFPSVFVLGGVSLALLVHAHARGGRANWCCWVVFNLLLTISFVALWNMAAQHHNTEYQRRSFAPFFMDFTSAAAPVTWIVRSLVHIGDYGTSGMGIPLLLLGTLGAAVSWSKSRAMATLLAGPLLVAMVAAALKQYPLGDRLCFFAVPCVWLLAAVGVGAVIRRLQTRYAWLGVIALGAILVPGAARTTHHVFLKEKHFEFREAFAFVHEQQADGDTLWLSHPEIHEVYYGNQLPLLSVYTPAALVEQAARSGRLWVIAPPEVMARPIYRDLYQSLDATHAIPLLQRRFAGAEVTLYAPAEDVGREGLSGGGLLKPRVVRQKSPIMLGNF